MTEQRTSFIGRVQEQRQFLVALEGALDHHRRWVEAAGATGPDFEPEQAPGDDSYACLFLLHGIGGIGKSWLTRRCLALAQEIPYEPPILTLYEDVSIGSPVLQPSHLLERLYQQLVENGYGAEAETYLQAKEQTPEIVERVTRYQFENRPRWDRLVQMATGLVSPAPPEPRYHAYGELSLALHHVSGAEVSGKDAATLIKAYDLLLEQMQREEKLTAAEAALFRNPPAAQAATLVAALKQMALKQPLVIGLDNLEIVVPLEPLIRDCLVLPTNQAPIIWILSGRHNLADERQVEIGGDTRTHKGYRDLLGINPPVVWDMSIFGDADLKDYLIAEAERRRAALVVDSELIEAIKRTSSGVPLVVEMVTDAIFTMDRDEFMRDFVLEDKNLLPGDRLEKITERFLRYCLTQPEDLERVQAMALLRKGIDEPALAAVWGLSPGQGVREVLNSLRARYAFVLPEGLHDAVYEFVRRQLRNSWQTSDARERLSRRAVGYYQREWDRLHPSFEEPASRIRDPQWQRLTRNLLNALLWRAPDEAVLFLLPRFVEGLGFDRHFSNGLLLQAEEFTAGNVATFSRSYANLLHRMRVGLQDMDWEFNEPGEAVGAMVQTLLEAPGLDPLHLSILHLWQGNWLVENRKYEEGLAAYLEAASPWPADALALGRQLGKAFYELSSRFLWPESTGEAVPSEAGLQAAQRATELDPEHGAAWFNLGVALDYLGREEEALAAYQRAIELEPHPIYYNHLGEVYSALGRDEEALVAYEQAVALDPAYAWPYHNLAEIYAQQGDYPKALNFYQQAIERHQTDRDRAVSWDNFGDVQAALGSYDEAISAYRWAAVLNARYAPPWYGLGKVYGELGRYNDAIEAFRRAIALDPVYPWSYHYLATMHSRQGDYQNALTAYQQAIERHETDSDRAISWNGLGDVYGALERPYDALEAYRQSLKFEPTQARAWHSTGDTYLGMDNLEAALRAYRQAVEQEPDHATSWHRLGDIYSKLERYDEAIEAYQRVIALDPDNAWPYNNLGFIYSQRGETGPALEFYRQAIERLEEAEPKAIAWSNLGDLQVASGNRAEAIRAYRSAIRLAPTYPWPYHNLGLLYEGRGEFEPALEMYQKAVERQTDDAGRAVSWHALADLYSDLERQEEAASAYQKVVAFAPDNVDAWNGLGDAHLATGQPDAAAYAYRQAIKLEPDFGWPYHSLARIAHQAGDNPAAVAFYRQTIERHEEPDEQALAWRELGDVYQAQGQPDEAMAAYYRATELDPAAAPPYYHLGTLYEARQAYETALDYYQQAVDRYPATAAVEAAQGWVGLGDSYGALGRLDEAIESYRQAAGLDPAQVAPWNSLGDIYYSRAQDGLAIESYEQVLRLEEANPHPYHRLGAIYARQGQPGRAIDLFRQALDRYPAAATQARATAWVELGRAYEALGQTGPAQEAYQQAIDLASDYVEGWHHLADIHLGQQRPGQALQAYRRVVELDPDRAAAWNSLGDLYRAEENYSEAEVAYQRSLQLEPGLASAHYGLGFIDETLQRYPWAVQAYEAALQHYAPAQSRERGLAWYGLGNARRALNREPEAMEAYRQAIASNPADARPYHHLGALHQQQGQYETALGLYRQALEHYPESQTEARARVWNALGEIYAQLGRAGEAEAAYRQAIDLAADYARPWANLGDLYSAAGRHQEALEAYERSTGLDPTDARVYHHQAAVYEYLGQSRQALALYQEAINRQSEPAGQAVSYHSLGNVHHAQGNYEEAIKAYQQAISLDPTYARPWNSLGDVYRAQKREEGVIEAYQRAISLEPGYAWPYHNLGLIYKNRRAYPQALNHYKLALERHLPDRPRDQAVTWHNLGDVYRLTNRHDLAVEAYQKAIQLNPADPWPYHNLAFTYKLLSNHQGAEPLYRQAIERFEDDRHKAVAWNNLGNVYQLLGSDNEALNAYRQALALHPEYALPGNSLGNTYSRLGRYREALEAYQQAARRDSAYLQAWNNAGDMYRQLNRWDEAIEAYNRAIVLEPAYAWAYHNLGLVYEEQGNYEAAIDHYRKAIDRHGNNEHKAILWDKVGGLYRLMNEQQRAIEAYHKATTLDSKYASPWYNLGNIYATLGRSDPAIAAYRKAIALNPADPWPYHLLALVYESREEYSEAVTLYKQAIERHQNDRDRAISWDTLGNVYHDQGRLKEAQHAFQEALRLNPNYALPWNSLGDVYVALRDYEQAAEAYRKAIALDPDYAWPYNNLGVVYEKLGQYDQAIDTFRRVIARHTDKRDLAVSWHNLGDIYGLLAREEEAIGAYEQAIRMDPDYTWPYNSLGVLYEKRGDNEQAYVLYQEATRRHKQRDGGARNGGN